MKRKLIPLLICPACLPKEQPLELDSSRVRDGDIISGELSCRKCRKRFPIRDGIAVLTPEPESGTSAGQWKYEESGTVDRYLWSHYADLMNAPDAGDAYAAWASLLAPHSDISLDAGCAVGRLAFEMSLRSELAIGCDLSPLFIRTARRLARERSISFSLPLEGNLRESFRFELPAAWRSDTVEFIVADAQALPFAAGTFQQISSLNLVDRVRYPLAHLFDINRVARSSGAFFLFSDPFSWSTANTAEELWLGGMPGGPNAGRGIDNIRALLTGKQKIIAPAWLITRQGSVNWRLRSHSNHYEMIRSEFLAAER
ncbi:MAG: methyltransferase domain-containing protein [Steroidobacteraceae bacterium]|nr:methyltransferase domain-containing protein [Deltaproteobacteria bacterium]